MYRPRTHPAWARCSRPVRFENEPSDLTSQECGATTSAYPRTHTPPFPRTSERLPMVTRSRRPNRRRPARGICLVVQVKLAERRQPRAASLILRSEIRDKIARLDIRDIPTLLTCVVIGRQKCIYLCRSTPTYLARAAESFVADIWSSFISDVSTTGYSNVI